MVEPSGESEQSFEQGQAVPLSARVMRTLPVQTVDRLLGSELDAVSMNDDGELGSPEWRAARDGVFGFIDADPFASVALVDQLTHSDYEVSRRVAFHALLRLVVASYRQHGSIVQVADLWADGLVDSTTGAGDFWWAHIEQAAEILDKKALIDLASALAVAGQFMDNDVRRHGLPSSHYSKRH
jgi:hypothetical protein